jgi:choline dehydrogenase
MINRLYLYRSMAILSTIIASSSSTDQCICFDYCVDYVVVGTGPGGAPFAKILTNDKKTSALVLEAGENHDNDIPIKDSTFTAVLEEDFYAQYFWQAVGVPQEGLNGVSLEWTTGRLAGGGSSINGEQYVRSSPAIYQKWENILGPFWSPEKVTNRFKRLENYNGLTTNPQARGFNGPVDIRQAPVNPTTMALKLVAAIEQATGFPEILDYNDPDTPLGPFTRWQLFQHPDGTRESASTAFFTPNVVTSNGIGLNGRLLRILYKTTAHKILFDSQKQAIGVEFYQDGVCRRARAFKKVILAAGINDAQLLMNSGIGPRKLLEKNHIPVVFDNPNVGLHLRNQPISFAFFSANPNDPALPANDPDALYTGGAFLPDPSPGANQNRRGFQLIGAGGEGSLTLVLILLQPKSRGGVKIQSDDPLQIVLANEGWYVNPDDIQSMMNAFRVYVVDIATQLAAIDPTYQLIAPSLAVINDDALLEEYIKTNFAHNHHMQSSTKMAPLQRGGVANEFGEVIGVKNLVIADVQALPVTADGNTAGPGFLVGFTLAHQLAGKVI